jgi:hypothetical protein
VAGVSGSISGNTLEVTIAIISEEVRSMNFTFLDLQSRLFS